MAEAAVEERPMTRFYCHMCNVEFQNAANVSLSMFGWNDRMII